MSVVEAAEELDLSPRRVRQLLAAGQIPGQQVGGTWVIERMSLDELRRVGVGRPWSPRSAWAVLGLASGRDLKLSPVERSRARRRLAETGLVGLVEQLRSRAVRNDFYAHPSALARIVREPGVLRGGVSAAPEHDVDLIALDFAEVYVRESQLPNLVAQYALEANADRSNLLVRVVVDDVWPFDAADDVAHWPVVAIDLLEAFDERSRRAGFDLIERHLEIDV